MLLEKHMNWVVSRTYAFVFYLMVQYFVQKIFFPQAVDKGAEQSLADTFEHILIMIIEMVAFIIAIIPEADSLTFQACLVNYNRQTVFQQAKIIYYNSKALEKMGETNCIMIDVTGH